jgi:hypothetical protein
MKAALFVAVGLGSAVWAGCGTTPAPPGTPTVVATEKPAPPQPTVAATSTEAALSDTATIPMYPVVRVYSLFEVVSTEGGIELRVGWDPGGGSPGHFRYVPLVSGVPDFEQETQEIFHADTTGGSIELVGKRPELLYHVVSGFRSSASDNYWLLRPDNRWSVGALPSLPGLGKAIQRWSKDRWLEWRGPDPRASAGTDVATSLPSFRVVLGPDKDKEVPSLPGSLEKRLRHEGFRQETATIFRSGEVIVVGTLTEKDRIASLSWTDNPKEPRYFVAEVPGVSEDSELEILGGDSLSAVRLRVDNRVMKLEGGAWAVESTVPKDGLPDVWFGSTLLRRVGTTMFARLAAGAPWKPVGGVANPKDVDQYYAVDSEGVIWKTEDDLLLSSKPPAKQLPDVTEEALVKARKASILRGGSDDVTGAAPTGGSTHCSMSYVLLDESPEKAVEGSDYSQIRSVLRGHSEFAKARFVVSREKGFQFFGALLPEEADASKLEDLVKKKVKSSGARVLCADPPGAQELKIDLATGSVVK